MRQGRRHARAGAGERGRHVERRRGAPSSGDAMGWWLSSRWKARCEFRRRARGGDGMTAAATNVRAVPSRRASRRASRRDALRAGPPRARSVAASVADEPPSDDTTDDWVAWERTRRARAREVTHALLHPGGPLEHRLIRAPLPDAPVPASLLALATGEPARHLRASLHPRRLRFPDVEDALRASCELTPGDRRLGARRLRCRAANDYLARLFLIASRPPLDHALTRHDLFHGHVFAARDVVGVLMRTRTSTQPITPKPSPYTSEIARLTVRTRSIRASPRDATSCGWRARRIARRRLRRLTRRRQTTRATSPSFLNCWRCRNCSRRTRETSVQSRGTSCIFTVLGIEDPNTRGVRVSEVRDWGGPSRRRDVRSVTFVTKETPATTNAATDHLARGVSSSARALTRLLVRAGG